MALIEDFQPQIDLTDKRVAVDAETGRIAVRVAEFGEWHSNGTGAKVPRDVNIEAAHVGNANLDDGSSLRVATLPMHTVHAPGDLDAMHAAAWYENSGTAIARVRYSVDDIGIRADGLLFSDVDDAARERLTAGSFSGDWRFAVAVNDYRDMEHTPSDFVGSCLVNVPGFSDTFTKAAGSRLALAASGAMLSVQATGADGNALKAASVGIDGISDDDLRAAWEEANGGGVGDEWSWLTEIYIAPPKAIASVEGGYVQVSWGVSPDGTITFGDRIPVERVWVPTGQLTAGGHLPSPVKESEMPHKPDIQVTLSAAAIKALTDGTATDEQKAAAQAALVAAGAAPAPDPLAEVNARMDRVEQLAIRAAFDADD